MAVSKGILFFKDAGVPIDGTTITLAIRSDWIDVSAYNGEYILYFTRTLSTGNPKLTLEITDKGESGPILLSAATTNMPIPEAVTMDMTPFAKIRLDMTPSGATGDWSAILQKVIQN